MIIVGGVYSEYCHYPYWNQIFGSGGRGAAALTRLGVHEVTLHTCLPDSSLVAAHATLSPYGIDVQALKSDFINEFIYTHPLADPSIQPFPARRSEIPPAISGDVVLVYGMLEGLPHISGRRLIFDPQSEAEAQTATDTLTAQEVALVLNQKEFELNYGDQDPQQVAQRLLKDSNICTIVIKNGPYGCRVIDTTGSYYVPVFPTRSVFKIGSGDIFSASFAKFWGIDNMSPVQAAQNASKCTALYCETRSVDSITLFGEYQSHPRERRHTPRVYLAGPFFSLAQRFLVEEARSALIKLGADVFSPLHEVGFDLPVELIAKEDLRGLESCSVVFALITDLDPGTIFEIGFAKARNIPVVMFGEGVKEEHLTMLVGTGCIHSTDFCSSIYNAIWEGM